MTDIADDDIPEVTLGWRLRIAMERSGLKAEDMAERLGVHRGTITRWTHDIGSPPRPIYVQSWANLCRVPYFWLAGDTYDRDPSGRQANAGAVARLTGGQKSSTRGWTRSTRRRQPALAAIPCRAAA